MPGLLVYGSGTGQFGRVDHFADVVRGRAEEDRFPVDGHLAVAEIEPSEDPVGDVVYGAQVGGESWWGV
ncbi:hypothetical protein GCM10023196_083130 [Actinoallomurus vinaceus]|uniref:Flavodoxin n=1 Tax=Actinoallomurus vinaceus TaxID=1080074 RepID=A0ABP8UQU7_9ACTN